MCESPSSTMNCFIGIRKYRRPSKDKLRRLPSLVHFTTNGIPNGRQRLPFVNQARSLSFQKRLGTYLYHLCALFQHRCIPQVKYTFGQLFCRCCLATPLRSFNKNGAFSENLTFKKSVCYSLFVLYHYITVQAAKIQLLQQTTKEKCKFSVI